MIRPSLLFELRHPWLVVLLYVSSFMLLLSLLGLLAWGWVVLRFSPIQRHYLPDYLQATAGVLAGYGPEYVEWIEKRGPGKAWEVAQPEDLVPAQAGIAPFQLSPAARSRGWSELGFNADGTFAQRDTRDYLETNFFGGHSLWFLVFQPFELILIGWLSWKGFDSWRQDLARERGLHWDPYYRPNTWTQDLELFLKQLAQGAKAGAVQARRWVALKQKSTTQPAMLAAGGATVSLSGTGEAAASIRSSPKTETSTPTVAKRIEVVPVQSPEPAALATQASQPEAPESQPVGAQPAPKSAPKSPFGKPLAEGEPERKWDISQWID